MDGEAGLKMREKRSSLESKVLRKCLIKTLTTQIILHEEFASVYTVILVRRRGGRKGGRGEEWREKRKIWETSLQGSRTLVSRYRMAIEATAGE